MFGQEQSGAEAVRKRWSIRMALRYLSKTQFDGEITLDDLRNIFIKERGGITAAEIVACKRFMQSLDDWRAADGLIDHIDGKLVERKVEAQVSLADLVTKSYEGSDGGSDGSSQPD